MLSAIPKAIPTAAQKSYDEGTDWVGNFLQGVSPGGVSFTRAGPATFFNSAGNLTTAATDTPRFDSGFLTGSPRGLLVEGASTNKVRNNTAIGATNGVVGAGGVLPTNWTTALPTGLAIEVMGVGTENGVTGAYLRLFGTPLGTLASVYCDGAGASAVSGQNWTHSLFIKQTGGSTANIGAFRVHVDEFNSSTGVASSNTTFSISSTLQRVAHSRLLTDAATNNVKGSLQFGSLTVGAAIDLTFFIGVAQLENLAFASSSILTSGTEVTRAADSCKINTLSSVRYDQTKGTFLIHAEPMGGGTLAAFQIPLSATNGTANNRIILEHTTAGNGTWRVTNGGVSQVSGLAPTPAFSVGSAVKRAFAYSDSDFAACSNGGTVLSQASGTVPNSITQLAFGHYAVGSINSSWFGWVRGVTYFPRRLSNAQLQAITT